MKITTHWPRARLRPAQIIGLAIALVACVIYFGVLHLLDGRAKSYLEEVRQSNRSMYLTILRQTQGFDTYLAEYTELEGYDSFRPLTPVFLVGRWTMRDEPMRLSPGTTPTECSNPLTLNYGLLLEHDAGGLTLSVQYRINGKIVEVRNAATGIMPIHLVSYGGQLDHIEFVPPGESETVYGYLCGR